MSTLLTQMHGNFVNTEHAMLFLKHNILNDLDDAETMAADQQVATINATLQNLFLEMQKSTPEQPSKLMKIFTTDDGSTPFFNSLSILVDSISQKYLRNHLTKDEKITLITMVTEPFLTIAAELEKGGATYKATYLAIIRKCKDILQNGLDRTVNTHFNSILAQSTQIHQQVQLLLAPLDLFKTNYNDFLKTLTIDDEELTALLNEISDRLTTLNPDVDIKTIQENLLTELKNIQENTKLTDAKKEKLAKQ